MVSFRPDQIEPSIVVAPAMWNSGSVRPLIQFGRATRHPQLPDVPTLAEQGVQGADIVIWYGLLTAARTPRAVIDKLNREVNRILRLPDVRARFDAMGAEIEGGTPEKFGTFIKSEAEALRRLIKTGAVSPE